MIKNLMFDRNVEIEIKLYHIQINFCKFLYLVLCSIRLIHIGTWKLLTVVPLLIFNFLSNRNTFLEYLLIRKWSCNRYGRTYFTRWETMSDIFVTDVKWIIVRTFLMSNISSIFTCFMGLLMILHQYYNDLSTLKYQI